MKVTDDRVCITEYDSDGVITTVNYGKSQAEQKHEHLKGKCNSWCAICYAEACEFARNNPEIINSSKTK